MLSMVLAGRPFVHAGAGKIFKTLSLSSHKSLNFALFRHGEHDIERLAVASQECRRWRSWVFCFYSPLAHLSLNSSLICVCVWLVRAILALVLRPVVFLIIYFVICSDSIRFLIFFPKIIIIRRWQYCCRCRR